MTPNRTLIHLHEINERYAAQKQRTSERRKERRAKAFQPIRDAWDAIKDLPALSNKMDGLRSASDYLLRDEGDNLVFRDASGGPGFTVNVDAGIGFLTVFYFRWGNNTPFASCNAERAVERFLEFFARKIELPPIELLKQAEEIEQAAEAVPEVSLPAAPLLEAYAAESTRLRLQLSSLRTLCRELLSANEADVFTQIAKNIELHLELYPEPHPMTAEEIETFLNRVRATNPPIASVAVEKALAARFEQLLSWLNQMHAADAPALHAALCHRVPCSFAMARLMKDFNVVDFVNVLYNAYPHFNGFGLLDLASQVLTGKSIAMSWSDDKAQPKFLGFCEYKPAPSDK